MKKKIEESRLWLKNHRNEVVLAIGTSTVAGLVLYKFLQKGEVDIELLESVPAKGVSDNVSIFMGGLSDDGTGGSWLLTIANETLENNEIVVHDMNEAIQDMISGEYIQL